MADRVERLPFTVYDIMGYLIPGVYLSIYIAVFFHGEFVANLFNMVLTPDGYVSIGMFQTSNSDTQNEIPSLPNIYFVIFSILFLVESFILGHVAAFISAETIERLCVAYFGYPSQSVGLDRDNKQEVLKYCRKRFEKFMSKGAVSKVFLIMVFFPHAAVLYFLSKTSCYRIPLKPLGKSISDRINNNFKIAFPTYPGNANNGAERFLMIDNLVFRKEGAVAKRQYNYVTIYGFCRNMCFAVYTVLILDVIYLIDSKYLLGWIPNAFVDANTIYFDMTLNLIMTLTLLLAFLKFFRRYSQDSLLTFATMEFEAANTDTDTDRK